MADDDADLAELTYAEAEEQAEVVFAGRRKKLTAEEQHERNKGIVSAKMRQIPNATIAETYGVSTRHVKTIVKQYREANPTLRHHDPIEIVDELLDGYQGAVQELAILAATSNNDAVRVGAVKTRVDVLRTMTELLQAIGALPNDLGTLRVEVDMRLTVERVIKVLTHFGVDPEVQDALVAALEGRDFVVNQG